MSTRVAVSWMRMDISEFSMTKALNNRAEKYGVKLRSEIMLS